MSNLNCLTRKYSEPLEAGASHASSDWCAASARVWSPSTKTHSPQSRGPTRVLFLNQKISFFEKEGGKRGWLRMIPLRIDSHGDRWSATPLMKSPGCQNSLQPELSKLQTADRSPNHLVEIRRKPILPIYEYVCRLKVYTWFCVSPTGAARKWGWHTIGIKQPHDGDLNLPWKHLKTSTCRHLQNVSGNFQRNP